MTVSFLECILLYIFLFVVFFFLFLKRCAHNFCFQIERSSMNGNWVNVKDDRRSGRGFGIRHTYEVLEAWIIDLSYYKLACEISQKVEWNSTLKLLFDSPTKGRISYKKHLTKNRIYARCIFKQKIFRSNLLFKISVSRASLSFPPFPITFSSYLNTSAVPLLKIDHRIVITCKSFLLFFFSF